MCNQLFRAFLGLLCAPYVGYGFDSAVHLFLHSFGVGLGWCGFGVYDSALQVEERVVASVYLCVLGFPEFHSVVCVV